MQLLSTPLDVISFIEDIIIKNPAMDDGVFCVSDLPGVDKEPYILPCLLEGWALYGLLIT